MNTTMPCRVALSLLTLFPLLAATASVPVAHCRNGDKTESGLQGLTTSAEIASGKVAQGFNCNADIVGQYQGEGASWQITAWKNCAYYDQRNSPGALVKPGVVVVDVSDPTHPTPTQWLSEPAMIDPWESLKVNQARQLLAGDQLSQPGFAIYDISGDCKHPVLKSTVNFSGSTGHTGQWAPDGNTYYITPLRATPSIVPVDTKDPANPKVIPCGAGTAGCNSQGFWVAPAPLNPIFHDLEFSKDGNTAYVTMIGTGGTFPQLPGVNGLVVLDVSDIQSRKENPAIRVLGSLIWDDGSVGAQNALPITIQRKPYVLFTDEGGTQAAGCAAGKSANGFPRLIDVSDPKNPKTVAKLQLDAHDPAYCSVFGSVPITPAGPGFFGHSCHYCNVDDPDDAKIAACSCFAAGLRVFDISNPAAVREIAYVKPPAQGTKTLPGSQYAMSVPATFKRNYDYTTTKVSFPKDRGMATGDIWMTSQDNGFLVVRLDPKATASAGGGGCASADASVGGLLVFALSQVWRRRRQHR